MKKLLLIILPLFLLSCVATAHKINNISLGMTKAEVIEIMGAPMSTSATEGVEYLHYDLYETKEAAQFKHGRPYFVRIVDGAVNAYGRRGDFDSTKVPEDKTTIDLNIKNQP
jgi:outer membrane protein assembly factor BamE (lipoprotein component of BamABCDE complex)